MVAWFIVMSVVPACKVGVKQGDETILSHEIGKTGDVVHYVERVYPMVALRPANGLTGPGAVGEAGFLLHKGKHTRYQNGVASQNRTCVP